MPSDSISFQIIAIDGGAATGKSSTARALAERLNCMRVDTGAHYRTLTCALIKAGADLEKPHTIPELLKTLEFNTLIEKRSAQLTINGQLFSDAEIRSPEVNAQVSRFAAINSIRKSLFHYQRGQVRIARSQGCFSGLIIEGRDIGSVIFPDADFRFFLFADETTRSARRAEEGQIDSIAERDKNDSTRKTAPLVCPEGAIKIDTGRLNLDQVVDTIFQIVQNTAKQS